MQFMFRCSAIFKPLISQFPHKSLGNSVIFSNPFLELAVSNQKFVMEKRKPDEGGNEPKRSEKQKNDDRSAQRSISVPPSSVFSDPKIYDQVSRLNENILRQTSPVNQQRWYPTRHLFWNGQPTPIFSDYRQMYPTVAWPQFYGNYQESSSMSTSSMVTRSKTNGDVSMAAGFSTKTEVRFSADKSEKTVRLSKKISESNSPPWDIGGLYRPWNQLHYETNAQKTSSSSIENQTFTLCSYNVLCQQTLTETLYLYQGCREQFLAWPYRWQLLQKEFSTMNADVYCLQEVEENHYETCFLKFFQDSGYDGIYKRRMGAKPDGCAIFWRRDHFNLLQSDSMNFQVANTILDRDNVALIVVLTPKIASKRTSKGNLIIANTHLLFNPGRGDIKLCQIAMLLARVQKISNKGNNNDGIIICGDFNATPYSPLYNFLIEGRLHYVGLRRSDISGQERRSSPTLQYPLIPNGANIDESTCRECHFEDDVMILGEPGCLAHGMNFNSAYSHSLPNGLPEVSTMHTRGGLSVDYILYGVKSKNVVWEQPAATSSLDYPKPQLRVKDVEDGVLTCCSVLGLPCGDHIRNTVGIMPNEFCASDHLPLIAKFKFN